MFVRIKMYMIFRYHDEYSGIHTLRKFQCVILFVINSSTNKNVVRGLRLQARKNEKGERERCGSRKVNKNACVEDFFDYILIV